VSNLSFLSKVSERIALSLVNEHSNSNNNNSNNSFLAFYLMKKELTALNKIERSNLVFYAQKTITVISGSSVERNNHKNLIH